MKSPLKAKPLHNPGESLERQLQDVIHDEILLFMLAAGFMAIMAALEWFRWFSSAKPNPIIFTAVALVMIIIAIVKIRRGMLKAKRLKLGRDGEKAVGQFLEMLRETGAKVFHDIPGPNFNLDHVVVHESGVYVIETKTLSKPEKGDAKLLYDGNSVSRSGLYPDRNAITQVRASSRWLSEFVKESTGRTIPVRSVVVYPGWFIEPTAEAKSSDVWVLNPKALPSFIVHSQPCISSEDASLCSYHLSRYIRAT